MSGWMPRPYPGHGPPRSPAVSFGSCFPFLDEIDFVVPRAPSGRPLPRADIGARALKSARSCRWAWCGPCSPARRWTGTSGAWMRQRMSGARRKSRPIRTGVRWSAAVDRSPRRRAPLHCLHRIPPGGLWTIVSFQDEAATRAARPIKAASASWPTLVRRRALSRLGRSEPPELPMHTAGVGSWPRGKKGPGANGAGRGTRCSCGSGRGQESRAVWNSAPSKSARVVPSCRSARRRLNPKLRCVDPLRPCSHGLGLAPAPDAPLVTERRRPRPKHRLPAEPVTEPVPRPGPDRKNSGTRPALSRPGPGPGPRPPFSTGYSRCSLPAGRLGDWRRATMCDGPPRPCGQPAGSGELKKEIQMVAEGRAVRRGAAARVGRDVAPDGFAHPVFRAGFALSVRCPALAR